MKATSILQVMFKAEKVSKKRIQEIPETETVESLKVSKTPGNCRAHS